MALTESLPHRPKIEPINRQQLLLRTVDIEQLVPEDDPVCNLGTHKSVGPDGLLRHD